MRAVENVWAFSQFYAKARITDMYQPVIGMREVSPPDFSLPPVEYLYEVVEPPKKQKV